MVAVAGAASLALNIAGMSMMMEPIVAELLMVGIVLLASSILIPIAGWLAKTDAQLINDQRINADLQYWMPRSFCSCQFV